MQNYVKLYFKKLLFMLLYVSLCLLIYFLGFSILVSIANIFENSMIRNCVLIGIPVGIIFTIVYCHRRDKSGIRRVYLEQLGHVKLSIKEELAYILHFPEFIAELLAFFTIILPVILAIGVASAAPWWADILAGTLISCISVTIFFIIDFTFWVIIHFMWKKSL